MLLEKYFSIPFYNVEGGAGGGSETAPVINAPIDNVEPPVVAPSTTVQEESKKTPWYMTRLAEEAAKTARENEARIAAERKNAEYEAMIQRLQANSQSTSSSNITQNITNSSTESRQVEIQREAARQRFLEDVNDVRVKGLSEFGPEFQNTINVLNAVGAASDDFVTDVLEIDRQNAHKILKKLADDPEKAVQLASMSSRKRTAELVRMTMTQTTSKEENTTTAPIVTATKTLSNAPAPAPRIEPSATKIIDGYADDATDEQFTKQFNERFLKRKARR